MAGVGTAISTSAGVIAGELLPNKFRFTGFAFLYFCLAPINALAGGIGKIHVVFDYYLLIEERSSVYGGDAAILAMGVLHAHHYPRLGVDSSSHLLFPAQIQPAT